jgi:RNA polymerase sigma-70 factor (ECF subfamily)
LIGKWRAFSLSAANDKDNHMQATQAHIESELGVAAPPGENRAREMQDALLRYLPSFHRRAYRYLGNTADAEDAVQDALLSACKHLDQFRGQAQMSTWLTAIVTNSARMQLRRRSCQIQVSLDEQFGEEQDYSLGERLAAREPSPEDECGRSELHGRLMELAEQLSPPLRKAFQLRDVEGLSTSEAAHVLGVAEGTVKAQVARARAKLRRLMSRALRVEHRSPMNWTASPLDSTE